MWWVIVSAVVLYVAHAQLKRRRPLGPLGGTVTSFHVTTLLLRIEASARPAFSRVEGAAEAGADALIAPLLLGRATALLALEERWSPLGMTVSEALAESDARRALEGRAAEVRAAFDAAVARYRDAGPDAGGHACLCVIVVAREARKQRTVADVRKALRLIGRSALAGAQSFEIMLVPSSGSLSAGEIDEAAAQVLGQRAS